jgi:hypothetical protein
VFRLSSSATLSNAWTGNDVSRSNLAGKVNSVELVVAFAVTPVVTPLSIDFVPLGRL